MGATLQDIARQAQVSHMTVSLVVNNRGNRRVSEETRRRVLEIAREVGYVPNRAAQALGPRSRTNTVAIWIRRFSSPFYGSVASEYEGLLSNHGYEVIVRGYDADRTVLAEWPVDGIVAVDNAFARPVAARELTGKRTAIVSAGVYFEPDLDHVAVDLSGASNEAVRHLFSQDCRRVAHLLNDDYNRPGDSRRDAYIATVTDAGRSPEIIAFPDDTRAAVAPILTQYIARHGCPDGLFCRNDELAIGAYRVLRDLGYRIPDDVCIVGCDGTLDTGYFDTPISTIISPVTQMCEISWDFLQARIAAPDLPRQGTQVEATLTVRASSQRVSPAAPTARRSSFR